MNINTYVHEYIDRIYIEYFNKLSEPETKQELWIALLEADKEYHSKECYDDYDCFVKSKMIKHIKTIQKNNNKYIREFGGISIYHTFEDSNESLITVIFSVPFNGVKKIELYDVIEKLGEKECLICKAYLNGFCDDEIIRKLNLSKIEFSKIKIQIQEDLKKIYHIGFLK